MKTRVSIALCLLVAVPLLFVATTELLSQTPGSECIDRLRKVYKRMNDLADSSKLCVIEYTISYTLREAEMAKAPAGYVIPKERLRAMFGRGRSIVHSKSLSVFRDSVSTVTIAHNAKTIYIADPIRRDGSRDLEIDWQLRDSVLARSMVTECRSLDGPGVDGEHEVSIELDEFAQREFGLIGASIRFDVWQGLIDEMTIRYPPGKFLEAITIRYDGVNYDYTPPQPLKGTIEGIFEPDGSLRSEYWGFRIVDTRSAQVQTDRPHNQE